MSTSLAWGIRGQRAAATLAVAIVAVLIAGLLPGVARAQERAAGGVVVSDDGELVPSVRFAGADRFDTAALIAGATEGPYRAGFSGETVVLATGASFPDALAGSTLAGLEDAPIVLTPPDTVADGGAMNPSAAAALEGYTPSRVVVLGGVDAIGDDVVDAVRAAHPDAEVERVGGADRFETAALVADRTDAPTTAVVADGGDFPDALVAGAVAAHAAIPLLLTGSDGALDPFAAQRLEDLGVERVYLAGGEVALSSSVEQEIRDLGVEVQRVGGATRWETAVAFAELARAEFGFSADQVGLAYAGNFPDALALAPRAAMAVGGPAPIVLTGQDDLGGPTLEYLAGVAGCGFDLVHVAGGTDVVSAGVEQAARELLTVPGCPLDPGGDDDGGAPGDDDDDGGPDDDDDDGGPDDDDDDGGPGDDDDDGGPGDDDDGGPGPRPTPGPGPGPGPEPTPGPEPGDKGPVGWDLYRQLDELPYLPSGVDTRQFSSFDRTGGNGQDGFNGAFSCLGRSAQDNLESIGDPCVIADAVGPGEVQSIWFTRDGGDVSATGDITIELDGEVVVDADLQALVNGEEGAPFVFPLVANADQSSGGVYIKVPMPYRESMRITTESNPFFYHVSYRVFDDAEGVETFDPTDTAEDVLAQWAASGTQDPKPAQPGATTTAVDAIDLAPGASTTLAELDGPGAISELRLRLPQVESADAQEIVDDGRAFGRTASTYSQFTATVDPTNTGVRLIRRYDGGIGNQRASILVDGTDTGVDWEPVPSVGSFSFELQTAELPAAATAAKGEIVVRNAFVSSDNDFNEFTYFVESLVGGEWVQTDVVDVGPQSLDDEEAHDYVIEGQTFEGVRTDTIPPTPEQEAAIASSDALLEGLRLQISFDGELTVDSPVGEFFGSGLGEYETGSLFFAMETTQDGSYTSWWPMPYGSSATVELVNTSDVAVEGGDAGVTSAPDDRWAQMGAAGDDGYFHATSRRGLTVDGEDWVFLDTEGRGKFVGVSQTMRGLIEGGNVRNYLEGDERVYVDGLRTPQMHGTGTEDFYEGGWYFNRGPFSAPTNGNTNDDTAAFGCEFQCDSVYRLMIGDAVPFSTSLRFTVEHGPQADEPGDYSSTAYWYGQPNVDARQTDVLDVGDLDSEAAHDYTGGGEVTELTSVFEGDFDDVSVTDEGRATSDEVTFTLAVDPANDGVRLRRLSDQSAAYQTVDVFIDGRPAGRWMQPLANAFQRWLEDTYLLPPALTAGSDELAVRLVPVAGDGVDGTSPWHAARYESISMIAPFDDTTAPGQVTGLQATGGESNEIVLTWDEATDDTGVARYEVYASADPAVPVSAATRIGTTVATQFVDDVGLEQTRSYRVLAVDGNGNRGEPSDVATATTGDTLRIEGEDLLPAEDASRPVIGQGNCCGADWSGGAQAWFQGNAVGAMFTLLVDVPQAGNYGLTGTYTQAPDYGIHELRVDGIDLGDFDGYKPGAVDTATLTYDETVFLTAGEHRFTYTMTGRNAVAVPPNEVCGAGYCAGVDVLELRLADAPAFRQQAFEQTVGAVTAGEFEQIYDPSVGETDDTTGAPEDWYYNDHTFIQGADGTWHTFAITHEEPANPEDETFFGHATADTLLQQPWEKQPAVIPATGTDTGPGESGDHHVWAPHVIEDDGTYYMYFAGGVVDEPAPHTRYKMQLATSTDLVNWTRSDANPLFEDGFDARDPMVMRVDDQWVMYYTANSTPSGGNHQVAYRTSDDLINWSEKQVAFEHPAAGTFGGPTESPFVVEYEGSWYLFVCCDGGYTTTRVYRSDDPLSFDYEDQVGTIDAHAAEVVQDDDGQFYVSAAGWGQDGLFLAPLDFESDVVTTGQVVTTPYYHAVVQTSPTTEITELWVDPEGQGDYQPALDDDFRGTGPYMAVGAFGETDGPGPAAGVDVADDGRTLMLTGIPLGDEPVTVDWELSFADETVDLTYDWHVTGPTTAPVWEVAWNWDTVLPNYGDPANADRGLGDASGFADWSIAYGDDLSVVAAYLDGSAWIEDNRFFGPGNSVVWQPFWSIGGRPLAPGDYAGGTWRLGASSQGADTAFADSLHAGLNGG